MRRLIAILFAAALLAADPIVITPAGPPVFSAPVQMSSYLVLMVNPVNMTVFAGVVPARSIPEAMATAQAMFGTVALGAWELQ